MTPNVHSEGRAQLLRASLSTVLLDEAATRRKWRQPVEFKM